ncbi:MAG TPA: enoyl-CoA hydratase-related protein [Streptosporangiaceae bacterium]|nr:enoyl-CoA hydratase-related protein [Streptosporangiaceae bacterium]
MSQVTAQARVEFRVQPGQYRHWRVSVDGPVATVIMDVAEDGGLVPGYELKLNSYDLGVDIELYDVVQRLRFEHPEVRVVVLTSGKDKVFCAGANIKMLAASEHSWKVNFCKFTNETRNGIEDATAHSGQLYLAALNGSASGGGYELALACEHIMLVDDRSSVVSLPELPLLGVLPGTGGLTRVTDKRHVRRDIADYFATRAEGVAGKRAQAWRLVDEIVPRPAFDQAVRDRALALAASCPRADDRTGIELTPLAKTRSPGHETSGEIGYRFVTARLDHSAGTAELTVSGPDADAPADVAAIHALGADFWPLAMARELDDLILDLRTNEPELGTWVLRTEGDPRRVLGYDELLLRSAEDWLANEIVHFYKRTLKRLDVTSRSLIALIEPGSCFAGSLLELALAADRSFMLDGIFTEGSTFEDGPFEDGPFEDGPFEGSTAQDNHAAANRSRPHKGVPAVIVVGAANLGALPMGNGLSRLATRFFGDEAGLAAAAGAAGRPLDAADAVELGLVMFAPDDIDWDDEIRLALEERSSFSPDALTGLEANYRFAGPETMETKIFGRLSAWQNWIFNRPNASGPDGALRRYGTGQRAEFDRKRV